MFLLLSISTFSQTTFKESEKIATFCKLWGFLKYYHPTVAKGKLDWDKEFTTRIRALSFLNSKQEINNYYSEWINSLGKVKNCKKCKKETTDSLKFNLDIAWLADSNVFTKALIDQLQFVKQNRNQGKNYYVKKMYIGNTNFKNEASYKDSIFPSIELRLLGLSRYWNIINYFYPYKYRIGQDWNSVLFEMIPKYKDSRDTISYHLAMLELTAKINDSHAVFSTKYTRQYLGIKWAPFTYKIIDNKAIVTGFYNDSLSKQNDIQFGDVFLKVNNLAIKDIIKEKSKYIGASNNAIKLRDNFYVFNGQTDSVSATFERNGMIIQKTIHRYYFKDFKYNRTNDNKNGTYKIFDGNVGYVNLGLLQPKHVNEVLNNVKDTKAIIFDVRNYPNRTMYKIANFLNSEKRPFVKFSISDISYPGVYQYTSTYSCGKKNNAPYTGKVILLFNEITQSHAEFTLMALQTSPNVLSIGSQTAGADGDVSVITFPGNYKTYMTGIGVYYPDGRETQRVGIVPDIEVKSTIEGLRLGKDEVLEKAIEMINKN